MAAPARIIFPKDKPLSQLMGLSPVEPKRLVSMNGNGNGKHPEKKGLLLDPTAFWLAGNPDWEGSYETPGLIREIRGLQAYKLSALAFACMSYRAAKLTEPPLWITEEKDGEEQWIEGDHELAQLLEEPNSDMDMHELLETSSLYLDGTGRVLWVKSRDKAGRIGALYPFSGDEFEVESTDSALFGKFTVQTSDGQKTYGPDDVIFWKNADARDMSSGLGPLEVALASVNIDESMRATVRSLLRNQMRPGAVAYFPNGLGPDTVEAERFKAEARANFAGASNAGKLMVVEGTEKKLDILKNSLEDLALGPISENVEAAICSCFKVHPAVVGALIGIKNSSSFADTIKPATDLFYDIFVIPTWTRFEKKLTRSLLREVDPNPLRFIRFDKSDVRNLQADLTKRTTEATQATGFWTRNEQRQHTGKPALEADDERGEEIVEKGSAPPAAPGEPSVVKRRKSLPVRIQTKRDARQRLWAKFDLKARREEAKYAKEAEAQFAHERIDVVKRIEGAKDTIEGALEKIRNAYKRKDGEYHAQWVKRYEDLISDTFDAAGNDLGAELGFDFDLSNPRVQSVIKRRVNKLADGVTDTTYDKIKDVVAAGQSEGVGVSEIAKRIRDDVFDGEITKARATAIARTETIGALNAAEMTAAEEAGIIASKEWLAQGDSKVRESHAAIDGQRVALDEPFDNGLMHPGDPAGDPSETVNCRCTLLFHDEAA